MNIWMEIKYLKGQTISTLDQHKPFTIVDVTDTTVIVRPLSTMRERPISREGIEAAMSHLLTTGQLLPKEIDDQFAPRSSIYVAAILSTLPEVQHSLNPIRLWIEDKH
jgi:hypothetical protein